MKKPLLKSRTFWANVVAAVVVVLGGDYVDPKVSAPIIALANIALRLLTTEPTSFTGK